LIKAIAIRVIDGDTIEVKLEDREAKVQAILLLEGYAQVATYPPDVKYVNYFTKFQQEAREASKGLWDPALATEDSQPGFQIENEQAEKKKLRCTLLLQVRNIIQPIAGILERVNIQ